MVVALNLGEDTVSLPIADGRSVVVGSGAPSAGRIELGPRGWAVLEA